MEKKPILSGIAILLLIAIVATFACLCSQPAQASNVWDANMTAQRDWEQQELQNGPNALDWYTSFLHVMTRVPMVKSDPAWNGMDGFTVVINDDWQFSPWVGSCVTRTTAQGISLSSTNVTITIPSGTVINKGAGLLDSMQIWVNADVVVSRTGVNIVARSLDFKTPYMTFSNLVTFAWGNNVVQASAIKDGVLVK